MLIITSIYDNLNKHISKKTIKNYLIRKWFYKIGNFKNKLLPIIYYKLILQFFILHIVYLILILSEGNKDYYHTKDNNVYSMLKMLTTALETVSWLIL